MRLSTTTSYPTRAFEFEKGIDILADAGYDAVDFSFFQKEYYEEKGKDEFFKNLRNYVESRGLVFNPAHAPFASSFEDENMTKKRFVEITNSMKYASLLGIKNIVVHPCHHILDTVGAPKSCAEFDIDEKIIPETFKHQRI